jgi:hypothetical protein
MLLLSLLSGLSRGVERHGRHTSLYVTPGSSPLIGTSHKNGQDACSNQRIFQVIAGP